MIKISVIVCTYNRYDMARECIPSLSAQILDRAEYEIILVDNNSSPDVQQKLKELSDNHGAKYIFEPVQGLSHARNTGVNVAEGKYVCFIDDDALANPNWLCQILGAFLQVKPAPAVVGGPTIALWEVPRPKWYSRDVEVNYGSSSRFLTPAEAYFGFYGVNMAFEKEALRSVGCFSIDLGYKGDQLISGEETLVFRNLLNKGCLFWYQSDAAVQHRVHKERLKVAYVVKNAFAGGRTRTIMKLNHEENHPGKIELLFRALARIVRESLLLPARVLFSGNMQAVLVEKITLLAKTCGEIYQLCFSLETNLDSK